MGYLSPVKVWIAGDILYAADLNALNTNILDYLIPEPGGIAQGDILYRGASVWERLAAGTSGYFLKTQGAGANPAWAAAMSNPMTAAGDIVYGGASGVPTRLAKGSALQFLRMNSGATAPEWTTPDPRILIFPASCFETRVASGWAEFAQIQGTYLDFGVLKFDKDTDEKTISVPFVMEDYDGGNITIKIGWRANATSGSVMWVASFKGVADNEPWDDTLSDHAFAADTAGDVAYDLMIASLTVDPAELAADEATVMKITRDADHASDTLAVDAELIFVQIEYTRS